MSQELIYTSAPRGLRPASQGFTTVAMTAGLPQALANRLESLSGYRPIYPPTHPRAVSNPVAYAHCRLTVGDQTCSVLSRVAFAGLDYTQRSNKLAHHLVLSIAEQATGGPAWVMLQPGVMLTAWSGEPRLLPAGRNIPSGDDAKIICTTWATIAGDAGWAGVLAQAFLADPSKPAYVLFRPGMPVLELIDQAIRLLPPAQRWLVTFNTCFTDLPAGVSYAWRCCVTGVPGAPEVPRPADALVIDLTHPLEAAPDGPLVRYARTGQAPRPGAATPPVSGPPPWIRPAPPEAAPEEPPILAPVAEFPLAAPRLRNTGRSPSTVFVIFVMASLLLALGGVWWAATNRMKLQQIELLQAQLAQAEQQYQQAEITVGKLRAMQPESAPAAPATTSQSNIDAWQQAMAERDQRIQALEAELVAARAARPVVAPPPVSHTPAEPTARPVERRAVVAFPDLPPDASAPTRAQRLALDAPGMKFNAAPKCLLLLPVDAPDLKVVAADGGCSLLLLGKNNVGSNKSDTLLDLRFQDGALVWTWREYPRVFQADKARAEAVTKVLQNAAVQLGEGVDAWVVQFQPLQNRDFHLDSSDPQLDDVARDVRSIAAFSPTLVVRHSGDWTVNPGADGHLLTFANTKEGGAAFIMELNATTGAIGSNWRSVRAEAEQAEKQAHDDRVAFEALLPQKTDAEIAKLGPEIRRQYDLLMDRREDEQRQRAIMRVLDGAGGIELDVTLARNRVVIYRIGVIK